MSDIDYTNGPYDVRTDGRINVNDKTIILGH